LADLPTKVLKEYRKYIQVIFQNPDSSLNPRKTIAQIIGRPLEIFGLASGLKKERKISELLEIVHLPEFYRDRYPHELSGGEKQRVGIAKALAFNPKFIVCDEPVTALDVSIQATILNLLTDLRERFDLSYLFIAHDLSVIAHVSDRVGVMYLGRFCEVGSVDEVFNPPYHPYTQVLLSAIPIMDYSLSQRPRIRSRGTPDMGWSYTGCPFQNRCPEKVGTICEVEDPPVREVSDSHFIVCHKPLQELEALKSPLIIKED
jgi:peptide/nickel transport system ATP-binding protein